MDDVTEKSKAVEWPGPSFEEAKHRRIFFNYSIDCEPPPDDLFGGPPTWEFAEASVRSFVQAMDEMGLRQGTSLFVYPDVAMKQRELFREMGDVGIEIALHLNTMRYSRVKKRAWLGSLSYEEQRPALRMAKQDLEDVTGRPCLGFRACYTSANHFTFPVLEELGFVWTSTSAPGSYNPKIFQRWVGAWPFPHHASRENKLIPGNMKIYEMPITNGIDIYFQGNPDRPLDLRAETSPEVIGPDGEIFRRVIERYILEMERRDQPLRAIIVGSHNTNPYGNKDSFQSRNLKAVCNFAEKYVQKWGYEFIPSSFLDIKEEADRVGAF